MDAFVDGLRVAQPRQRGQRYDGAAASGFAYGRLGLSFVFALMAAAIACLILRMPRKRFAWLLLLPGLYLLPDIPEVERGNSAAILVQPNISDDTEWTPALVNSTERQLSMLSLSPVLSRNGDAD